MRIIDAHTHLPFNFSRDDSGLKELSDLMEKNNIEISFVTLNTLLCKGLRQSVSASLQEGLKNDPYLTWNIYLGESILFSGYNKRFVPFFYLPIDRNLAKKSAETYEKMFGSYKFGYKVHSQEFNLDIDNLAGFTSKRPMIIHPSIDECALPKKILNLAKTYEGNILLAHFAKFDLDVLKEIRRTRNTFIDSSVSSLMFNALKSSNRVFKSEEFKDVKTIEQLYSIAAAICGKEKLLFATDYPVCNTLGEGYEFELNVLHRLSPDIKSDIAYENALKFLQ